MPTGLVTVFTPETVYQGSASFSYDGPTLRDSYLAKRVGDEKAEA
jgi:hypothetical protein